MRQIAKSILLRLTAEEYDHLKATADATGLKLEPNLAQIGTKYPERMFELCRKSGNATKRIN